MVGVAVNVTLLPVQILFCVALMLTLGETVAVNVTVFEAADPLPQVLVGVTVTLPDVVPKVTVIDVVPCPLVIVDPAGTVHV